MPTSNLQINKAGAAKNSNVTWDGGQLFEEVKAFVDEVNVLTADVARTVASGTLAIGITGTAIFSATQAGILTVGDYIVVNGAKYTIVSGSATNWVVTPPPAVAISAGTAYTVVNAGSYVEFPSVGMTGCHPIPELFRIRFSGTGTLSATYQFVRANKRTGVETPITTAVATTAAAVWQGVAADALPQLAFSSSVIEPGQSVAGQMPVDEAIRLVCTAKTTTTTGRVLNVEMGLRRKTGATNYPSV